MINCEQDLLVNLIELSPRNARRKFRQSIFEVWEWKCAYCDKELDGLYQSSSNTEPFDLLHLEQEQIILDLTL